MAYANLAALSNLQSQEAQFFGNDAARVADPYGYQRRNAAADKFDAILANPGSVESSPFFKWMTERRLNAARAGNAAGGFRNSGRGQLALMDAAGKGATESFFPLAELYGKASGALNPLSPAAAGFAIAGANRSQDYAQMGAAARKLADRQRLGSGGDDTSWWMRGAEADYDRMLNGRGSTGLPTGGGGGNYTQGQLAGAGYPLGKDPRMMTNAELDRAAGNTMLADYQPTYGATDTAAMAEQNYWGYDNP